MSKTEVIYQVNLKANSALVKAEQTFLATWNGNDKNRPTFAEWIQKNDFYFKDQFNVGSTIITYSNILFNKFE